MYDSVFFVSNAYKNNRDIENVTRNASGVVYIADSQKRRLEANEIRMQELSGCFHNNNLSLPLLNHENEKRIPMVVQLNKKDLQDSISEKLLSET